MKRHFTATTFVVCDGKTLLHWHRKLGQWMPPGGHLLPDEDPVTAALREVREETALDVEIIRTNAPRAFECPAQLDAPRAVLLEDIPDAGDPHQHIDLIYFARSLEGEAQRPPAPDDVLVWVSGDDLERRIPVPRGDIEVAVPEDVRALALEAIRVEREMGGR